MLVDYIKGEQNMELAKRYRSLLIVFALVAFFGPNAYYLYWVAQDPGLNQTAWSHPVAAAFMAEAMMLLTLFLGYVYVRTRSWAKVGGYLVLSFV
jgi:hypothetical protein